MSERKKSKAELVRDEILRQIQIGNFARGAVLPPERELCQQFDIGRGSLQAVFAELTARKLIRKIPGRALLLAGLTGAVEIVGTLIGYFAVNVSESILPFALAFAGGTMLYVISDEMIPETHAHGSQRGATYALLVGFCIMLITDFLLG